LLLHKWGCVCVIKFNLLNLLKAYKTAYAGRKRRKSKEKMLRRLTVEYEEIIFYWSLLGGINDEEYRYSLNIFLLKGFFFEKRFYRK
jgi:hypothetical protein